MACSWAGHVQQVHLLCSHLPEHPVCSVTAAYPLKRATQKKPKPTNQPKKKTHQKAHRANNTVSISALLLENATFEWLLLLHILVFHFLSEMVDFYQGSAGNENINLY